MKKETFFEKYLEEWYPNATGLRKWWERNKMNRWFLDKKNADFIEQISEPEEPKYNFKHKIAGQVPTNLVN